MCLQIFDWEVYWVENQHQLQRIGNVKDQHYIIAFWPPILF